LQGVGLELDGWVKVMVTQPSSIFMPNIGRGKKFIARIVEGNQVLARNSLY
jgi:hypothetical protein